MRPYLKNILDAVTLYDDGAITRDEMESRITNEVDLAYHASPESTKVMEIEDDGEIEFEVDEEDDWEDEEDDEWDIELEEDDEGPFMGDLNR